MKPLLALGAVSVTAVGAATTVSAVRSSALQTPILSPSSILGRLGGGHGLVVGPQAPSTGPSITVTSPARASFTSGSTTLVSGTVTDASGGQVTVVTVNGNPVSLGQGGAFSETVSLSTGLNTIDIEATDSLGVTNKVALSLLQGQFQATGQPIANAIAVRLNQGSLDAVAKVIASKLSGQDLTNALMARNPLATWSSWVGSARIDVTQARFGNPSVTFSTTPGDLHVHVEIPNVDVEVHESGGGIVPSCSGHVSCDDAVFDASVAISVASGAVSTSVVNDNLNLVNFNWGINGIPDFITSLFKGPVQSAIDGEVRNLVKSAVPPEVNKMIAAAISKPFSQKILGTEASFTVAPRSISIDGSGISATADVDCTLATKPGYQPLPGPGSLVTQGGVPKPQSNADFLASINADLLDRMGYAVWQAGIGAMKIDASSAPVSLPPGYPLDMSLLYDFLPELAGTAPVTDPLAIVVTPLLPPVFTPARSPNNVEAALGEVKVDFVDEATSTTVLTIAVHMRAAATLEIGSGSTFTVHMADRPTVDTSLVASLAPNVNLLGLDNLLEVFLPTIVQAIGNQWSGFPLPTYPGLTPSATTIYEDGAQDSFVTAACNFAPGAAAPVAPAPPPIWNIGPISLAPVNILRIAATTAITAVRPNLGRILATTAFGTGPRTGPVVVGGGGIASLGSAQQPGETIDAHTGYVCLVKNGLEGAVLPLLAGYQNRGVGVALVPLSDVVAQGRDRAEQIRNWLIAHCNDGQKRYLLLVGGPDSIPFRTCVPSAKVGNVVSDLYYGDLSGNWDADGNGVYGEVTDQPAFDASLYVGRIPFDDQASVEKAVASIEAARANRGTDSSKRILLCAGTTLFKGDDPTGAQTAKELSFAPDGWSVTTAFAPESPIKGDVTLGPDTIVDQLTAQPAALMMTFSHGSSTGLMSHPDASTWNPVLTIPQLAQLPASPPVFEIAIACDTADPSSGTCIGAQSLQNGMAGWLGCTIVTDPLSGGGCWLTATLELSQEVASGTPIGLALADTVRDMAANGLTAVVGDPAAQADLYGQAMSWVIYGDPGLSLGPKAR
jgi:hypothetical protein